MERYLTEYKIVVYKYGSRGRDVIFKSSNESNKRLNLLHHEGYYNVITSLTAAFGSVYFCKECNVPFDHKNEHRCSGTCSSCQQSPKCPGGQIKIKCDSCRRYINTQLRVRGVKQIC